MKKLNYAKGLEGVIALESAISRIDGKKGTLIYMGYSIEDLAKNSSFEEVAYLLWNGKLPDKKQLNRFKNELYKNMKLPFYLKKIIMSMPKKSPTMSGLRTCISLLSQYDRDTENLSINSNKRKSIKILALMPSIIAGIKRAKEGKKILNPIKNISVAGNFLYMLHGVVPTKEEEKIMDVCLILHADHGLNASTFSSRVTVSTLSDMHSGIISAIGTLKGPLHGGANKKAIQSLHFLGNKLHVKDVCENSCIDHVDKYIYELLDRHERIMGIGHRVYKIKDPRAKILEKYAKVLSNEKKYYQMAKEIEKIMAKEKKLYPNVDFFSGIVYSGLKIDPEIYVCIFAFSRTAGWLAHIMEQYSDNRLIRPRANYIGDLKKKYVKINKR